MNNMNELIKKVNKPRTIFEGWAWNPRLTA